MGSVCFFVVDRYGYPGSGVSSAGCWHIGCGMKSVESPVNFSLWLSQTFGWRMGV